ncbi:Rieske (2Fe-2S) protein [Paenibacillus thalictri]|uniref:Rieske domain-containing protein n=1 Tax=Paenibacillus thalictri TaxID=2527873 RepID=A0A4Q9DIW5_9BACL|nr:Rieske 2Fe-2S domain-containing protein [Paenibacillus thalictri]TBL73342.1 hypothetical protein EYB31_27075 [Paenibacillus thalictri]
MKELFRIAIDSVKEKESQVFCAEGHSVVVHKEEDVYYAFENSCPHKQMELHEGQIKNGVITCPWHRFRYDLQSGLSLTNKQSELKIYRIQAEAEQLVVYG